MHDLSTFPIQREEQNRSRTRAGGRKGSASNQVETMISNDDGDDDETDRDTQQSRQARLDATLNTTNCIGGDNHSLERDLERRKPADSGRSEWGLMQIVESAESKLMRGQLGKSKEKQLGRPAARLQLLKSPAFATNTLDEQDLERLAREPSARSQQQRRRRVSDCGSMWNNGKGSSTTNMINRRRQNPDPDTQEKRAGEGMQVGRKSMELKPEDGHSAGYKAQPSGRAGEQSIAGGQSKSGFSRKLDQVEDERGGPTPTNDLIRALIQRDRAALQAGQSQRQGETKIKSPPRNVSNPNSAAKYESNSLVGAVTGSGANCRPAASCRSAGIRDGQRLEQTMEAAEVVQQQQRQQTTANLTSGQGNNDTRDDCAPLLTAQKAPKQPEASSANKALGQLPAMMQQRLNLQEAKQVVGRAGQAQGAREARRRSVYMLPLVLKKRDLQGGADSDDDTSLSSMDSTNADDDDGVGAGLRMENDDGSDQSDTENPRGLAKNSPAANNLLQMQSTKLRMSASSPSALSTPTNLDEPGGCGGACCQRGPAGASQAGGAASAAAKARRDQGAHRAGFQAPKLSPPLSARLPKSMLIENQQQQRRYSLAPVLAQQQELQEQRRQKRISSNPLDRFRFVGSGTSCGSNQRQNLVNQVMKGSAQSISNNGGGAKRHSLIISGGSQLVSKLSHPRSLFSHNNSIAPNQQRCQQQRGSMEFGASTQQQHCGGHYDPLIPESGFKIVVMGTSGSGKTSIIQRFMYNTFNWRHNPTVEDTYFIEFPHMKNVINISISDTSGTYQFPAMRRLAINSGDAFILVYSVDNPQSFDDLEQLRQTILDEREQAYLEASASITSDNSSTSGLASTATNATSTTTSGASNNYSSSLNINNSNHLQPNADQPTSARESLSPRHWSLASIFNNHTQQNQNYYHQQHCLATNQAHHSSLSSSMCSSSCSSSADNSRRSSVSAAEAALKTRRTRWPPMVIVANKHDLPAEQHLVNSDEIEALAVIDWNNGFVRASAAMNLNIDEIFQQVLKQAKQPPTLTEAIVSKRRKSLPPKLPNSSTNYSSFRKDLY